MQRRGGWALLLCLLCGSARAESGSACAGPRIVLEHRLAREPAWSEAAVAVRERISELSDVDSCATLNVTRTAGSVRIRARAGDGRSAERKVSKPDELEPVAVALLVLPPEAAGSASGSASDGVDAAPPKSAADSKADESPTTKTPVVAAVSAGTDGGSATARANAAKAKGSTAFEVAAGPEARVASPFAGLGAAVLAGFDLSSWLLGGTARGGYVQGHDSAENPLRQVSGELGAVVGRRFALGTVDLDLLLKVPAVAVQSSEWSVPASPNAETAEPGEMEVGESAGASGSITRAGSSVELRAGALARGSIPLVNQLRAYTSLDADRVLTRFPIQGSTGAPLSDFSFGASIGVLWIAP